VFYFKGGDRLAQILIVGGGPVDPGQLRMELNAAPQFIVAADRGGRYLREARRWPELLVGDFDSLDEAELAAFQAAGVTLRSFPPEKDWTDLELALDAALEKAIPAIRILGGLGGRLDHTLSNIGLLVKAFERGANAVLLDPTNELNIVGPGQPLQLKKRDGWAVSLIPLSAKASGVTTAGLAFPLHEATLFFSGTRGIHNCFNAGEARVEVAGGILLAHLFRED
jgi:thiamine pyrophosphokinase